MLSEYSNDRLQLTTKGGSLRDFYARWYMGAGLYTRSATGVIQTAGGDAAYKINLQAWDVGASGYEVIAALQSHATDPFLEVFKSFIPGTTKAPSLGSATKYFNQAFIDAIICSNSIDLDPTPGDAVIYFKHDGAANEASLRYDKVNKRLELWIDGAIVGYCNAALGWVNGPP
jgi:hypothetical protein